jgi:hypothetical protein
MNPEGGRRAVGATHARRSTVAEKPIKVDETTDRVVTELAFFFRTTKKSVVATAVAEYASRAEPHRTPRPGPQPPTVLDLAPLDRLALRRDELVRAFEVRHAHDIRLAELEPEAMGASQLVLLAETDPIVSGVRRRCCRGSRRTCSNCASRCRASRRSASSPRRCIVRPSICHGRSDAAAAQLR